MSTRSSFLQNLIKKPKIISKLEFKDISKILIEARNIFENENLLLEFNVEKSDEIYVIGDIHGNLETLTRLIEIIDEKNPRFIISLGDIVDRGVKQLECLVVMLSLKILNPTRYFILKGNHETLEINIAYGFFMKFVKKFDDMSNYSRNNEKFKAVLAVYNVLPICALINDSILCLHGGIPEDIDILKKLKGLKPKHLDHLVLEIIKPGVFQIFWNDPKEELRGFKNSFRGSGIKFFGEEVFNNFMEANNLKYLIRAHECFPEGYRWFFNKQLLSIFSAANYRGIYSPNPASYAIIKNNEIIPKTLKLDKRN